MRGNSSHQNSRRSELPPVCFRSRPTFSGFTILELLVVIAIIALLSAVAVPAIRGLSRSNTISSANRQLLDDFALARQRAINERTIVHVVFVPLDIDSSNVKGIPSSNPNSVRNNTVLTNLLTGGQRRYALYAERSSGDQPGQHHPRYLTGWHTLPDGIFIPERELARLEQIPITFPTIDGAKHKVPHIAFDLSGAIVDATGQRRPEGAYLELARGSVMFQRDPATGLPVFVDALENPKNNSVDNYNRIRMDGLTGRGRVERPEIQ
jgi:prepilin-type N-terminal cleavage/methylation domain-containing protein